MTVQARSRVVYFSPRRRRHFMTSIAAARAEAGARIKRFFPTEKPNEDDHSGWHFTEEPRLVAVFDRLVARYMRQLKP